MKSRKKRAATKRNKKAAPNREEKEKGKGTRATATIGSFHK